MCHGSRVLCSNWKRIYDVRGCYLTCNNNGLLLGLHKFSRNRLSWEMYLVLISAIHGISFLQLSSLQHAEGRICLGSLLYSKA
ncbi:unnamed protein product [Linum tenue]|uniref:Uncharacterized protein n=1 Tax=Linum tenue TaxID=586396 RepID=A0AAV0QEB0_9ROSI|nr:unnamed protein product [Linum tenue]